MGLAQVVVDLGSGTGLLLRLFLENGSTVHAARETLVRSLLSAWPRSLWGRREMLQLVSVNVDVRIAWLSAGELNRARLS